MSRSDNDRLGDIIRAGRRLAAIVACGREAFDQDWTLRDAASHQIEIVVDAYTKLGAGTRKKFGDMPVEEMTGMRIQLAHMYWQADYDIVWDTIADDIPDIVEGRRDGRRRDRGRAAIGGLRVSVSRSGLSQPTRGGGRRVPQWGSGVVVQVWEVVAAFGSEACPAVQDWARFLILGAARCPHRVRRREWPRLRCGPQSRLPVEALRPAADRVS